MIELREKEAGKVTTTSRVRKHLPLTFASVVGHIALGTLSLLGMLVIVESIFALAHVGEDTVVKPDPLLGYAPIKDHKITFRCEGYSRSYVNAQGFRDKICVVPKPAGVKRVCVLGDSMTAGFEVPLANTFPKVLEKRLQSEGRKVEVFNCGLSGTGTGQQFLSFRRDIKALQPDMLILAYHHGDNDDNAGGGTNPPRPAFKLDEQNTLRVDFSDLDKFFAGETSRFYSEFGTFRSNCRILSVWSKADLDLHSDPTYKFISKYTGKLTDAVWTAFLKILPPGDWHIKEARTVAADLDIALKADGSPANKASAQVPGPIKASANGPITAPVAGPVTAPVAAPAAAPASAPATAESTAQSTAQPTGTNTGGASAQATGRATSPSTGAASAQATGRATSPSTGAASAQATVPTADPATSSPASLPGQVVASAPAASTVKAAVAPVKVGPVVNTGQQDIDLLKGMIYVQQSRMRVTSEIIRRLNDECKNQNCELVIASLPTYNNTTMYFRELDTLKKQANEQHFRFISSSADFPQRAPMEDSPFYFAEHFNCAGHQRMSDALYNALFKNHSNR